LATYNCSYCGKGVDTTKVIVIIGRKGSKMCEDCVKLSYNLVMESRKDMVKDKKEAVSLETQLLASLEKKKTPK